MLLVTDTNVLVSECLRSRGRPRLASPAFDLFVTARVDDEFRYELSRRLTHLSGHSNLSDGALQALREEAIYAYESNVTVVRPIQYEAFEPQALLRIPQDPDDWPTVALALALNADVWTEDQDFFGCGLPVWRTYVLYAHLDDLAASTS
ncbi:PIN domain-containing protein [Deinococcus aestuarii]|uniref:PIN domain-containing protein n=1 Tax=Deinococcus aestuarii TaxID=2774531 RepID=UPI001C0D6A90|nr:PIN domain-containing protein [Deinococcus aestuarii]